jgi:hypothetical protein
MKTSSGVVIYLHKFTLPMAVQVMRREIPGSSRNPITGELTGQFSIQGLLSRQITTAFHQIDVNILPGGVNGVNMFGEKGVQVGKFIKQKIMTYEKIISSYIG